MLKFIDLSTRYVLEGDKKVPYCAFLDTITMKFLANGDGTQVFTSKKEVEEQAQHERLARLIPPGFWEAK